MNSPAADLNETDRQFCWQQVQRIRPLFRVSYPYAPQQLSPGLLALHALFAALEETLCRASDESVSRLKLAWWQQELLGSECHASTHPITRQLQRSAAITPDVQRHLRGLLTTTFDRVDSPAPKGAVELESLCQLVGLYPMRLELAMQGERDRENESLAAVCAVNGMVQLLRESSRSHLPAYHWVPLATLAKFGLTRQDLHDELQRKSRSDRARQLMRHLCSLGLSWRRNKIAVVEPWAKKSGFEADWRLRHRHWIIQSELNARLLKKLCRLPLCEHRRAFAATGPGDVWLAWRLARQHARGNDLK